MLTRHYLIAKKSITSLISKSNINLDNIDSISPIHAKELKSSIKKVERTELAAIIFPQSMLVALVSQYDYLIILLVDKLELK